MFGDHILEHIIHTYKWIQKRQSTPKNANPISRFCYLHPCTYYFLYLLFPKNNAHHQICYYYFCILGCFYICILYLMVKFFWIYIFLWEKDLLPALIFFKCYRIAQKSFLMSPPKDQNFASQLQGQLITSLPPILAEGWWPTSEGPNI